MKVTNDIIYVGVNDHQTDCLKDNMRYRMEWLTILT